MSLKSCTLFENYLKTSTLLNGKPRDDHKKVESLESVISMYHSLSLGVRVPKHVSLLFYSHY